MDAASRDVDIHVMLDADTWVVGDLQDLLDELGDSPRVAGCIAHYGFPTETGHATVADWTTLAEQTIGRSLIFEHEYALVGTGAPEGERKTPFYVNAGAIFITPAAMTGIYRAYLPIRRVLSRQLAYPYFSGQVGLALAVAATEINSVALPMRFNLPNDESVASRYPEDVRNARIIHYLRTEAFDRHRIFTDAERYRSFLDLDLAGINRLFQDSVRTVLSENYPFR